MESMLMTPPAAVRDLLRRPPLSRMMGFERRRHSRLNTYFKAKVSTFQKNAYCDVLDVSAGGARLRPHSKIDVQKLTLHILGLGSWFGDIVWRRNGEIGVQFRDKMEPFILSSLS